MREARGCVSTRGRGRKLVSARALALGALVLASASACDGAGPTRMGMRGLKATSLPVLAGHPDGTIFAVASAPGPVEVRPDGTLVPPDVPTQDSMVVWRTRPDGGRAWTRAFNDPTVGIGTSISTSQWAKEAWLIAASSSAVTKLSPSGERVWTTGCFNWDCNRDPNALTQTLKVAATADGGALVAEYDNRLIRLGADGAIAWTSTAVQDRMCNQIAPFIALAEAPDGTLLLGTNSRSCDGVSQAVGMLILRLDPGGRVIAERTLRPTTDPDHGVLMGMGLAPDGSILAVGTDIGTVDYGDGSGIDVLADDPTGGGFAMKMAPDFSLIRVVETPLNLWIMGPTSDGGLLAVLHRGLVFKGTPVDPYLLKLDADLRSAWSVPAGNADTTLFGLAVAGDQFEVVGAANNSPFVSSYRF
jgi:hypothetical protein